jgi:hypothetical protein
MVATVLENVPRPADAGYPRVDIPRLIDDHLGLPRHVRDTWQKIVQGAIEQRRIEQLHAAREEYRGIVQEWVEQLEWFVKFCRQVSKSAPIVAEAEKGLADLREFRDTLFCRWQTLDDLHEIVVAQYQLPADRLKAHAAANPIPQSWYDEDFEGLFADDEE